MAVKKKEKELFATIGMSESSLDRRERLLAAKAEREHEAKLIERMRSNWKHHFA